MAKFSYEANVNGETTVLMLKGPIDEDFKFDGAIETPAVNFDFQGIDLINSCGIREWIKFIEGVNGQIKYVNVPQIVVEQINMVKGLLPESAVMETFATPYYCDECDKEVARMTHIDEVKSSEIHGHKCPECQGEMELDVIEKQYFLFVK
jgi:DNA-directed RNA polymerase subunit RPC12/RpoP